MNGLPFQSQTGPRGLGALTISWSMFQRPLSFNPRRAPGALEPTGKTFGILYYIQFQSQTGARGFLAVYPVALCRTARGVSIPDGSQRPFSLDNLHIRLHDALFQSRTGASDLLALNMQFLRPGTFCVSIPDGHQGPWSLVIAGHLERTDSRVSIPDGSQGTCRLRYQIGLIFIFISFNPRRDTGAF